MPRIRILRQIENLTRIRNVTSPDGAEISCGIANRMRDEHLHLDGVTEREFERAFEDRAEIRTEARISLDGFDGSAANLERQETGRVDNLFREGHLKMTDHFAAALAPTLDGGKRCVLKHLATFVQCVVERAVAPFREDCLGLHAKLSNHVEAAVYTEHLAGYVAGCVRRQEQDHRRDLLRPSEPLQRNEVHY